MHPYCPTMPCMPRVANFAYIPNMGVALLSCIISNARTKAKAISCSPLSRRLHDYDIQVASNVMSDSADCSSFINAPHEYFDSTVVVLTYVGLCTFEFGIVVEIFGLPRLEMGRK